MTEKERIAGILRDHPIPELTEDGDSVLEDPLGVHKPSTAEDGAKLNFTKEDLDLTVRKLSSNPIFFQKHFLTLKRKQFTMSAKQVDLVNYCMNEQFVIGVFNRQGGKSTSLAVVDVHDLCFAEGDETYIFAPIKDQSDIIFGKVKDFLMGNELLWNYVDQKGGNRQGYLRFVNGNDITVMSASDQSHVRGHSPTKIQIDESQDISDFKYYEDILPSGSTTDAKIQESGTPMGRNHFYDTWRGDGFKKVMQIVTESPYTSKSYVEMMRQKMPKASFDQEFFCVWNLDIGSAFDKKMLDNIFTLKEFEDKMEDKLYFAGVDVGKSPARTVLSVLRQTSKEKYKQAYMRTFEYDDYTDIIRELADELAFWNPVKTCIDRTGVGDPVADLMMSALPGDIVPIFYKTGLKQNMVDRFTLIAERPGGLALINEEEHKKQFMNWKKKILSSGRVTYKKPPKELDDTLNADLLATWAVDEEYEDGIQYKYGSDSAASKMRY